MTELSIGTSSWVAGEWAALGDATFTRSNPARPEDVMGPYGAASEAELGQALGGAANAQAAWAQVPAPERGRCMLRAADAIRGHSEVIAHTLTRESGKTLKEARAEVEGGARILEFVGGGGSWGFNGLSSDGEVGGDVAYTRRFPLGTVAVVTPWNFPFSNPCIKIASALVAGNAVIWKPASWTPATALWLTQALTAGGVPPSLLNTLLGSGEILGPALLNDPRIAALTFTGSNAVGRVLAAALARHGRPVQLEMGGKNAVVILEGADVNRAADAAVRAAFLYSGQKCTAASRVIIEHSIAAEARDALVAATARLRLGDPEADETDIGPVIHETQLEHHLTAVRESVAEGARVIVGGEKLSGELSTGHYMAPTIVEGAAPKSRLAQEEIFGPVLSLFEVRTFDDAVALANDSRFGLTAAVYTDDLDRALQFANTCDAGVIKVNAPPPGIDAHLPTGGWKESGSGARELGPETLKFFSREKTIYLKESNA